MKKFLAVALVMFLGYSTFVFATKSDVKSSASASVQKTPVVTIYNKPNMNSSIIQKYKDNYDLFVFEKIKSAWAKVADVKTGQMGWVSIKQNPQFKNLSKAEVQRKIIKDRDGKIVGITTSVNSDRVSKRVRTQTQQLQQAMDRSFMKIQQDMQRQENDMQRIFDNVFDYPSDQNRLAAPKYADVNKDEHYI